MRGGVGPVRRAERRIRRVARSALTTRRGLLPIAERYLRRSVERHVPDEPVATVPLERAEDVLISLGGAPTTFHAQTYIQELAFAHEFAAHGRPLAVTEDPSHVFEKRIVWFVPGKFVRPVLWDYSRQAVEFAQALEAQGNIVFCSSDETRYWENKAHMHRMLERAGVPTPRTILVTDDTRGEVEIDMEPVIVKEEHSASSVGLHYFDSAAEARAFVRGYGFRPGETLVLQELVRGATRDLRMTIAGSAAIEGATYWRIKSPEAVAGPHWTPTATSYGSVVEHGNVPVGVASLVAEWVARLGIRTAGVDLIWPDDDVARDPLMLELSPYYQPNPPKPERYADWSYREFKRTPFVRDGYLAGQYRVFRSVAAQLLEEELL